MKLLRVKANGFKNCEDCYTIDMVPKAKKMPEDLTYELQEVASNLYVYNTGVFVGKNASGKTSALELLDWAYSILGDFRLEGKHGSYDGVQLEIIFYDESCIYRYRTALKSDPNMSNKAIFVNQTLERKIYYKSYTKKIYWDDEFEKMKMPGELPEDTSILFFTLKKRSAPAMYYNSEGQGANTYAMLFKVLKHYQIGTEMLASVLRLFDTNVSALEMKDEHNYQLKFKGKEMIVSDRELIYLLSSGTTKGLLLYVMAIAALQNGSALLVDELENHFHKTLVENLIFLFKDPEVNRHGAVLLFTTHYCELLNFFNRHDNIWIAQTGPKVELKNLAESYELRPDLIKSKRFYDNAFGTNVDYDALMDLKTRLTE